VSIESMIAASKERCHKRGLVPEEIPMPRYKLNAEQLQSEKSRYREVLSVFSLFTEKVLKLLSGTPHLIVVANDKGYLLETYGDPTIKAMVNQFGISEGIQMDEECMGTNTVYLSLQYNRPIQLLGPEHFHATLEQTACYSIPFHFQEGNLIGTATLMTSIDNHHPTYLAMLANMVDSVEREMSLRRIHSNQTLIHHLMVSNARNGVILTDKFGNVTEMNAPAEKMTGKIRNQLLGTSAFSFEHIGGYFYDALMNGKRFDNVELSLNSSLETRTDCLFDAFPIYNDRNELLGAFAQLLDITERVELEKQIITSEKFSAIGKLAAGLAHEIRNPLTSVMGFVQLMHANKNPEKFEMYFDIFDSELQYMKDLVSDFVVMAKPSTPDKKLCKADDIVKETIRLMETQAILKNTVITSGFHAEDMQVNIDPLQIKQVLMNLIQNAIDAIANNGLVRIQTHLIKEKNAISITVEDNGLGMNEDELKQILNPFFSTKENGIGLGLSVSYRIIENHRGTLTAVSQKGVGTRFEILLPLG
jgi:two-component system, sporulation sensor kinase E